MSFFSELRRRNVFKIGAAYVIVAWIIMQVTDLAAPALYLPTWVTSFVVFLLAIGFPVALVLAWAFEVTPDGIKKTKAIPLGQSVRRFGGRKFDFAVIALLVGAVLLLLAERSPQEEDSALPATKLSIAVLPFENMSEDPDQEHFADGLAEELLNLLAASDDLRVISRTSSFSFKGKDATVPEIAATLGVDFVLEGSVRRDQNTVRVTAQLIASESDSHMWSDTYDRQLNLGNILEIQDEIAARVVGELHVQLLPQNPLVIAGTEPASLKAFDLYHDGMFYLRKIETGQALFEQASFEPAIEHFEASIAADPEWAAPRAALGRVYHFGAGIIGNAGGAENMRISKAHVTDAIRLDDKYGPAYGSLGYILTMATDFNAAKRALDRAASLNIDVSWEQAILMMGQGRYEAAIDYYRRAINYDPLSTIIRMQLVEAYGCAGRYTDVIETIEGDDELVASELVSANARTLLAEAYVRAGNHEKGLEYVENVASNDGFELLTAPVFALVGDKQRARDILDSTTADGRRDVLLVATLAAVLGEDDRALTALEQAANLAIEQAHPFIILAEMKCSPEIRELSGDPRHAAIVNRLVSSN